LKRTRRIEIIRYTLRITRPLGDDDAVDSAGSSTAIDRFSMTQVDTRSAPEQMDEVGGPAIVAPRTSRRQRGFWLDWLKRE
jgi:hypothetical protein